MLKQINSQTQNKMYLIMKNLPLAYDGNKKKIFKWISSLLVQELQDAEVIFDGFSGTGIISAFLALNNYQVFSNDIFHSAYALTTTLSQNPGEIILDNELEWLSSHRCIDGIVFDENEIFEYENEIHKKYSGVLTLNEANWLKHLNVKLQKLSPYKQLIAHCAIRGISTIVPFNTANGSKKFQYRIKQKDKYGQRCLGFYYNSSYEIEYIKWFKNYVEAFNKAVLYFAENRKFDAIVYRNDIFKLLENNTVKFDAAYFDPPYGRKHRIGYEDMYSFQEQLLEAEPIDHAIFTNPESHRRNFNKLLQYCDDIPKLIFSYDSKSWTSLDEICLICKRFGRTINILSTAHCHGKIAMPSHKTPVYENLIIASKK